MKIQPIPRENQLFFGLFEVMMCYAVINTTFYFLIIAAGLIPAFLLNRFLVRKIKPKDSPAKLLLYFLLMLLMVVVFTTLLSYISFKVLGNVK